MEMHIKKIMLEGEKGRHKRVNTVLFYLYQCIKQKKIYNRKSQKGITFGKEESDWEKTQRPFDMKML